MSQSNQFSFVPGSTKIGALLGGTLLAVYDHNDRFLCFHVKIGEHRTRIFPTTQHLNAEVAKMRLIETQVRRKVTAHEEMVGLLDAAGLAQAA